MRYNMPLFGRTIAVGVSGGADSMALLHVLLELKDEFAMNIIACHVNHGIRGETADRDEKFVVEACKRLGVDVRILRADVPGTAKKMHLGVEECGRRIRYDFFNSVAGDVIIATAHTLSDRSETLLLNIARGASVKGLCSIPAVRGNIVRPLIDCTRADIEKYCSDNSIEFVTDETNFEDIYSRNRIRLNVIPELKKLSYFVSNHSVPIVVVFILILIPFAIAQNKTEVYYTLFDSLPQDLTGIVGTNKLGEDFGMTTSHFILVHDDLTATEVSDLCDELKDVDGITQVVSLDSITGPGFQTELLPDSIMEILQSGGYKLILANSSYKTGTDANRFYKLNPYVADIPEKYSKDINGVKLLVMGTVDVGGSGCVCPEHVMLKSILSALLITSGL